MIVGNIGAEVIAKGVANRSPSTMAGGMPTIPKVNKIVGRTTYSSLHFRIVLKCYAILICHIYFVDVVGNIRVGRVFVS